jgi:drug/metabolite transporter (DMT)-like permease
MTGQLLSFLSVAMQSCGKVLYGTFLVETPTIVFLLYSFSFMAVLFLAVTAFRIPSGSRKALLLANLWTAIAFLTFFFALKSLSPATVTCVEMATSIIVAAFVSKRDAPKFLSARTLACAVMVLGAGILAGVEWNSANSNKTTLDIAAALAACFIAGASSAFLVNALKALATAGWSSSSVLAHRFYGTLAIALVWLTLDRSTQWVQPSDMLFAILAIAVVAVLLPMLLMQAALRRTDILTVLICAAIQPLIALLFSMLSPSYLWNPLALLAVALVSIGLLIDLSRNHHKALIRGAFLRIRRCGLWAFRLR